MSTSVVNGPPTWTYPSPRFCGAKPKSAEAMAATIASATCSGVLDGWNGTRTRPELIALFESNSKVTRRMPLLIVKISRSATADRPLLPEGTNKVSVCGTCSE